MTRRDHRFLARLLVVIACVLAPLSVATVWMRDQVLDENAYVSTVSPLSRNPAIDAAVADDLTKALFAHVDVAGEARRVLPPQGQFLALPLASGLRDFTRQTIDKYLASAQFHRIWVTANREAHRALVAVLEGRGGGVIVEKHGVVSIDLSPAALAIRHELDGAGITVFDGVPKSALERSYVIGRSRWLARARFVFELRVLALAVPAAALAAFALALAVSRRRRRVILEAGVGLAIMSALAIAAVVVLRAFYLDHVVLPSVSRDAGAAFFDTVTRKPRLGLRLELLAGFGLVAVALAAGPSRLAAKLRASVLGAVGGLADEAAGESLTFAWVAANKSALRLATLFVGLLVLVASAHPTARLLVKLAAGVVLVLAVIEILARPTSRRS